MYGFSALGMVSKLYRKTTCSVTLQSSAPSSPPRNPPKGHMKRNIIIGIVVIALVVIIAASLMPSSPNIDVTAENIQYINASTGTVISSQTSKGFNATAGTQEVLTVTTSYSSSSGEPETIEKVTVTGPGFSLVSVQPTLPMTINSGGSQALSVTIQLPSSSYIGPITIDIYVK